MFRILISVLFVASLLSVVPTVSAQEGPEAKLLVSVAPVYPRRAMMRGQQGWVRVIFTVEEDGSTSNVTVLENCAHGGSGRDCKDSPNTVFDSAAIKATAGLRYEAAGKKLYGITHVHTFELLSE